jgi:hypothetical protein
LLAGYSFSPDSSPVSVTGPDIEGINFVSTGGQTSYSIYGLIREADLSAAPGVRVELNPGHRLAFTDATGTYGFTGLGSGTFTLEPYKQGWSFSPTLRTVSISGSSENNADFTGVAPPPGYTISGQARVQFKEGPQGIPGVKVQIEVKNSSRRVLYTGFTDSSGNFSIAGVHSGSYHMSVNGFGYLDTAFSVFTVTNEDQIVNVYSTLIGGPSWKNFAASYVANNCTSCHRPDSQTAALPPLRTYEEVVNAGSNCNLRIQAGTMPPSNPSLQIYKEYFKFWEINGFKLK